jgi:hypothetical protein
MLDLYERLLQEHPPEEKVQKFLEEYPVLWSFLSPQRILYKPCVLTRFGADFAILNTSRILFIIEIEKPETRLATNRGGVSAELQRGLDQIRDWRVVAGNYRHAVLAELGFYDEVDDIRYVLIAGMARQTSRAGLLKLRRNPPAEALLYCFDELGTFLRRVGDQLTAI